MDMNRRSFVKTAMAGTAAGVFSLNALGANERVRLGVLGTGNRGGQLMDMILKHPNAEIVALCDVYQPHLDKARARLDGRPDVFTDYRKLLERKDIDAVFVASPDHWHALQCVDACDAGKDVYVEKPLSVTIHEGRRMVEAARRTNRVVQVGVQRRSSLLYADLAQKVRDGLIGKVTVARTYRLSNMWPAGMGKGRDADPPADLDWDLWLGPRPHRPFRDTIAPYKFRWWGAYSSQIANWGIHFIDSLRWILGEEAPDAVVSLGGRFAVDDDRDIPDTMETTFQLPGGCLLVFGQYEANQNNPLKRGHFELRGTNGTLYVEDGGYEIVPEKGGQFQDPQPRMEAVTQKNPLDPAGDFTVAHIGNFLDCVKSRALPVADVETGHRSTTFSHLGNIALATESLLKWDAKAERVTNNEAANSLLHYEYREPWKLG